MKKICFVSFEIHPTVKGGCGVFLSNAAQILLTSGFEVVFLLDVSKKEFNQFSQVDRLNLPNADHCRAYHVQAMTQDIGLGIRDFKSIFEYRSYRFQVALGKVYDLEQPDVIEFFDYCGVGYFALNSKVLGLNYREAHLAVRLHGSLELIDRQQPGNYHGLDRYIMYGLEHHALRLAETVLYPSRNFLEAEYSPNYEPWFGENLPSAPPLLDVPDSVVPQAGGDIVLFYGRLVGIKGIDLFVDAAILYLSDPDQPRLRFYMAGYDSYLPPGMKSSYQAYLRQKIPYKFQDAFVFTGYLNRQELQGLLPKVAFAVVPSYFESFCYAAHELYAAGIPMIVNAIPVFREYFRHRENALHFDGTVNDLARQITLLSNDLELRQKITHPYPVIPEPLGGFYASSKHPSWIVPKNGLEGSALLVCVINDRPDRLDRTLKPFLPIQSERIRLIILHPVQNAAPGKPIAWFLGGLYTFEDDQKRTLNPPQIITEDALLILKAGDSIDPEYIELGLDVLQRQAQISFVGCWKRVQHRFKSKMERFPLDAALELLPLLQSSIFSRFIMRTDPGKLLIDLFDPRAAQLGELAYLWEKDQDTSCGIIIPKELVSYYRDKSTILQTDLFDYLLIRDDHPWRKRRLARLLLSLANRRKTLRKFRLSNDTFPEKPRDILGYYFWIMIEPLGRAGVLKWMGQIPWLKRILKKVAGIFIYVESD